MAHQNFLIFALLIMGTAMVNSLPAPDVQLAESKPAPGAVTRILLKEVTGCDDKEALVITIDYEPGGSDPPHRHWAQVFVYVLEGSIIMQKEGEEAVTLTKGQTFYETREDIHIVGKNASDKEPAKFLVFAIKVKGAEAVLPVDAKDPSLSN